MSRSWLVAILLFAAAKPAFAFPCLVMSETKRTLAEEFERSDVVVYGTFSNFKSTGARDKDAIDFRFDEILRDDGKLGAGREITLQGYVASKGLESTRLLVFFDRWKGKLDPSRGVHASPAIVAYLRDGLRCRKLGTTKALEHFARFLTHSESAIAEDALLELQKSNWIDLYAAAKAIDPEPLRRGFASVPIESSRSPMFAFLLGISGNREDLDRLATFCERPDGLSGEALAGCVLLDRQAGWSAIRSIVANPLATERERFSAWRAMGILHECEPTPNRKHILENYRTLLEDPDVAEAAIDDLRQWKEWKLTPTVLGQMLRPDLRKAILRYALTCPLPEAREVVAQVRTIDAEFVREQEELLTDFDRR
jgi:hypothetical protein